MGQCAAGKAHRDTLIVDISISIYIYIYINVRVDKDQTPPTSGPGYSGWTQ